MAMKFHGTFEELHDLLDRYDICGSWQAEPNGVHMLRSPSGANVHWAAGSKSIWIDGKTTARETLALEIAAILH